MRKKALIFGVDGQDGSLMSDFLIKKKYKVTGTFKNRKLKNLKKLNIYNKLKLIKCDITNTSETFQKSKNFTHCGYAFKTSR